MNYEKLVKKEYPRAECDHWPQRIKGKSKLDWPCKYNIRGHATENYDDISGMQDTPDSAWKAAYERLKNKL